MQIQGLHKNIYRLSSYALSQEKCEPFVWKWRKLKQAVLSGQECQEIVVISQATYYRYKRTWTKGFFPCLNLFVKPFGTNRKGSLFWNFVETIPRMEKPKSRCFSSKIMVFA
jgi:hypothetical protein